MYVYIYICIHTYIHTHFILTYTHALYIPMLTYIHAYISVIYIRAYIHKLALHTYMLAFICLHTYMSQGLKKQYYVTFSLLFFGFAEQKQSGRLRHAQRSIDEKINIV